MKLRETYLMIIAFTALLTLSGATMAKADLEFSTMQGTWWMVTKNMDKGYLFHYPPEQVAADKPKNFKDKLKAGFLYFSEESLNGSNFEDVRGVFFYTGEGWRPIPPLLMTIIGGTPTDFACLYLEQEAEYGRMMLFRLKLAEDKKQQGEIKSGQMSTLSGSVFNVRDDEMFVGTHDLKAKWVPADKVPQEVKDMVLAP